MSKDIFIRFGKFSKGGGQSKVGLDSDFKKDTGKMYESGLSVLFVKKYKNGFLIKKPIQSRASYRLPENYFDYMINNVFMSPIAKNEIFLVTGDLIKINFYDENSDEEIETYDTGSDGEPVIENVKIIKKLKPEEVYINEYETLEKYSHKIIDSTFQHLKKFIEIVPELESVDPDFLISLNDIFVQEKDLFKIIFKYKEIHNIYKNIDFKDFMKTASKIYKKTKDINKTISLLSNITENKMSLKDIFFEWSENVNMFMDKYFSPYEEEKEKEKTEERPGSRDVYSQDNDLATSSVSAAMGIPTRTAGGKGKRSQSFPGGKNQSV